MDETERGIDRQDEDWPSIGIVILNWNGYEDTAACLDSLSDVSYPNVEVLVVDNGSSDNSGIRLKEKFNYPSYIFNESNRGFAGGCNIGINYFLEEQTDYVLLLNNDCIVESDFLKPLVETAEQHEAVAGVSGLIYTGDGNQIWYAGGELHALTATTTQQTELTTHSEFETEFVTGALVLLPQEALNSLGALEEGFFFGGEDKDFSYRARKKGWKLFVNPSSKIYHEVSGTSGNGAFSYYHMTWNRLHFARLHLQAERKLLFFAFFFLSRLVRILQWGLIDTEYRNRLKGTLLGIFDFFAERSPKKPNSFDQE